MATGFSRFLSILREPVLAESRRHLREKWNDLPEHLRTSRQMYGRQGGGCGATIGVMPRCDFACRGCYLGKDANHAPAVDVSEVERQIDRLRSVLGDGGNLQLTDGEVTLRPVDELIRIIRYAISRGLIPMLMTHGDTFRRRPGLLERLMDQAGLSEISVHVDTTQRGRRGAAFRHATSEDELNPLRDEFAALVRRVRANTGLPLRCAMTMTVTRDSLAGVPTVARWAMVNADVVHVLSFQPVAMVGRTDPEIASAVDIDRLWCAIADGLFESADGVAPTSRAEFLSSHIHFGHPSCNRVVPGLVARARSGSAHYVSIRRDSEPDDRDSIEAFLSRFGGISLRRDTTIERAVRLVAIGAREPLLLARGVSTYVLPLLRRIAPGGLARFAWNVGRGKASVHGLLLVSHHFMNTPEMHTPIGQERLRNCVFRVAIGDELVAMCAVNGGLRDQLYVNIRRLPRADQPAAGTVASQRT